MLRLRTKLMRLHFFGYKNEEIIFVRRLKKFVFVAYGRKQNNNESFNTFKLSFSYNILASLNQIENVCDNNSCDTSRQNVQS